MPHLPLDSQIPLTRNALVQFSASAYACVCVFMSFCVFSTCHFVPLNRCVRLLTVGVNRALLLRARGGGLAAAAAPRSGVSQAPLLQTGLSRPPPPLRVGSCPALSSSCRSKFLSSLPLCSCRGPSNILVIIICSQRKISFVKSSSFEVECKIIILVWANCGIEISILTQFTMKYL